MSLATLWRWAVSMFVPGPLPLPPWHIRRWIPIELAVRLRTLQRGINNVGNTQQNRLALTLKAAAEATAPAGGEYIWARWNPVLSYKLEVDERLVPGYVAPAGTNL